MSVFIDNNGRESKIHFCIGVTSLWNKGQLTLGACIEWISHHKCLWQNNKNKQRKQRSGEQHNNQPLNQACSFTMPAESASCCLTARQPEDFQWLSPMLAVIALWLLCVLIVDMLELPAMQSSCLAGSQLAYMAVKLCSRPAQYFTLPRLISIELKHW